MQIKIILSKTLGGQFVFLSIGENRKQDKGLNAQLHTLLNFFQHFLRRPTVNTGHGGNGDFCTVAFKDKQRINK